MACVSLGALVLTATLLGQQALKIESKTTVLKAPSCATATADESASQTEAPENANATLILKDEKGVRVYESKVAVTRYRYYVNDTRENHGAVGGVFPTKQAVLTVKYPLNEATNRAVSVELKTDDGTYWKQSDLPRIAPRTSPTLAEAKPRAKVKAPSLQARMIGLQ